MSWFALLLPDGKKMCNQPRLPQTEIPLIYGFHWGLRCLCHILQARVRVLQIGVRDVREHLAECGCSMRQASFGSGSFLFCCDHRLDIQLTVVGQQDDLEQAFFREPFLSPSSMEESSAIPKQGCSVIPAGYECCLCSGSDHHTQTACVQVRD